MQILLANPRGFCAGVNRAIEIVEQVIDNFGAPVYVRHEVVHNRYVVDCLRNKGAIFVDDLHDVPNDSIVIFSAHGVSKAVKEEAEQRKLRVFDATCPLVTKVHLEVAKHDHAGRECILIGHAGHPEVEGTLGQYQSDQRKIYLIESVGDIENLTIKDPDNLVYVTQTTLSTDDTAEIIRQLKIKFPNIKGPKKDDICYATQNRQDAVKTIAKQCDLLLVVGSQNSSNSNRLRELAQRLDSSAYLIDSADDIQEQWVNGANRIGVTAGASAPEILVQQVIDRLREMTGGEVKEVSGIEENVQFSLPKELKNNAI